MYAWVGHGMPRQWRSTVVLGLAPGVPYAGAMSTPPLVRLLPIVFLPLFAACGNVASVYVSPSVAQSTWDILDGNPANAMQVFSTVAVVATSDGQPFCTGTLIGPNLVLTAAHCVVEQDEQTDDITREVSVSEMAVTAGILDATQVPVDQRYAVTTIVRQASYPGRDAGDQDGLARYEDIAMLLLDRAVTGMTPATVVAMAETDSLVQAQTPVTITGYGTRDQAGNLFGQLYLAQTPFVRRNDHEFVAGQSGSPDTCPGDSGGPVYVDVGGAMRLLGVTSRGVATAQSNCGAGGVYTLVPAYAQWIADHADGSGGTTGGGGGSAGDAPEEDGGGCRCSMPPVTGVPVGVVMALGLALGMRRRRR